MENKKESCGCGSVLEQPASVEQSCGCGSKCNKKRNLIILFSVLGVMAVGVALLLLIGGVSALSVVGDFISNQVLGMKWLNDLVGGLFASISPQFASSVAGLSIQFFIYDTIKIVVLLCVLIFIISYVQSFFPPSRTKQILGNKKGILANVVGALLGTVTPFCSCSSIPLFIGFTKAGISSGITFSFLISSPLVDFGAFILLASVFGFPVAFAYVVVGLVLAVVGGTIIEKFGLGKHIQDYILEEQETNMEAKTLSVKERVHYASGQMLSTLKKVWIYILVGVGIGALIHNIIPESFIDMILGQDKWYSVLLASLVGVPMYADIFGTIPVAEALFFKGVGVGTILSFMMSVTALSLPSLIMLKKVVKTKLLVTFIIIVVIGIIIIGYGFNFIAPLFI